jgi:hypothetical protein
MVDSIKITALQDIGANIAYTTLVPLVNMAGTPTTQKANLQILGNLILNGAGGSYFPRAAQANLALNVANAAQPNITSVGNLTSLRVTGNITTGNINGGNIVVANFYYGDGGFLTNIASPVSSSISNGTSNVRVDANGNVSTSVAGVANMLVVTNTGIDVNGNISVDNVVSTSGNLNVTANGASWLFGEGGALYWPASSELRVIETNGDGEFEIKSTTNVIISTDISDSNAHFTFDSDGIFTAPSNVNLLGSRLNVGPEAANVANLASPTLIIANSAAEFIQAAILNINSNGSADWIAQGADSNDEQGFSDLGFAGHSFNDPNFTITAPGDGYVFSQGYANGIGGSLVLATGENGNVPDIIFATGGFLANAEFARMSDSANTFEMSRANSTIVTTRVTTTPVTVSALPSAATAGAGARAFVTDANSITFNASAVGGGANNMPVFSNGTGWFIG